MNLNAFECFECGLEFAAQAEMPAGMAALLAFPCKKPKCCNCNNKNIKPCGWKWCSACRQLQVGRQCDKGACPQCGSLYVEWLSREIAYEDVWFSSEWTSGKRVWLGSICVKFGDTREDYEKNYIQREALQLGDSSRDSQEADTRRVSAKGVSHKGRAKDSKGRTKNVRRAKSSRRKRKHLGK